MPGPFSDAEVEQFKTDGLFVLRRGFPRDVAPRCRDFVWREILCWQNCITANQPMVHVQRNFSGGPFVGVMTARVRSEIDQLTGAGRAIVHESFGWWPVLFPGFPGAAGTWTARISIIA